jgi:hypothetical protein
MPLLAALLYNAFGVGGAWSTKASKVVATMTHRNEMRIMQSPALSLEAHQSVSRLSEEEKCDMTAGENKL